MTDTLRLAIAQLNPTEGAVRANLDRLRRARAEAAALGADLVLTPEFSIAGYPPEDLVRKPAFIAACEAAIGELAAETGDGGPAMVVGGPWREGEHLFNAAYLLESGRIAARRAKHELPNYGVFDDKRVFDPGPSPGPVPFRGFRLGLMICEDWWYPAVCETLAESGAEILLSINGSPYETDKHEQRLALAVSRVVETGLPYVFCAQVGGQDELVFDGASFAMDGDGKLVCQMPVFEEGLGIVDLEKGRPQLGEIVPQLPVEESVYKALCLGVKDYVEKNGFPGVVLGLSGGIDSALTLAIAVDALGAEKVQAVMMPSEFTADMSLQDAQIMAGRHKVRYSELPIKLVFDSFLRTLSEEFDDLPFDTTEENIQARIRGTLLMALSNKYGTILLTTGNKSEMAVGYATLYGDMAGGFSVLKDVPKTMVYRLARYRNSLGEVIPERVITRAPSAELRHNQTDQDALPPYEVLDAIMECYVEHDMCPVEIMAQGFDEKDVRQVVKLIDRNEFKRRQAPVGVRVTPRGFGKDRRYPITSKYRPWAE